MGACTCKKAKCLRRLPGSQEGSTRQTTATPSNVEWLIGKAVVRGAIAAVWRALRRPHQGSYTLQAIVEDHTQAFRLGPVLATAAPALIPTAAFLGQTLGLPPTPSPSPSPPQSGSESADIAATLVHDLCVAVGVARGATQLRLLGAVVLVSAAACRGRYLADRKERVALGGIVQNVDRSSMFSPADAVVPMVPLIADNKTDVVARLEKMCLSLEEVCLSLEALADQDSRRRVSEEEMSTRLHGVSTRLHRVSTWLHRVATRLHQVKLATRVHDGAAGTDSGGVSGVCGGHNSGSYQSEKVCFLESSWVGLLPMVCVHALVKPSTALPTALPCPSNLLLGPARQRPAQPGIW